MVNIQNGTAHFDIAVPEAVLNDADKFPTGVNLEHPSVTSLLKRGLDILGAIVGLMITAIIFIPIAFAIQIDNPGPILYSQLRCGHQGRTFRIWKFRSMVMNADKIKDEILQQNQHAGGVTFKMKDDPRITKVGKYWIDQ